MTKRFSAFLFTGIFSGAIALSGAVYAMDGDAEAGKKVFKKCKACHVVEEEKNKVGPHLINIFGRQPGSLEGFKFSKAMKTYGEAKVWDEATLAEYLAAPKKVVKGTKMAFAGLKKDKDLANVIAYLKGFSAETPMVEGETDGEAETETETSN